MKRSANHMTDPKFERIPINKLRMDVENPRISKWIEMYGGEISADQMALALNVGESSTSNSTTFTSLKESIRSNCGIIHPIIVNREKDSSLTVIEGNTRTLIYGEFKEQGVPGNWETIPSMVYERLDKANIDSIRLQAHLVGPRPWDPYSKAKYLNYLSSCQHLTSDQIVDFCGGKKREVTQLINAYNDMETYYRMVCESDDEFDTRKFSGFVEIQAPNRKKSLLDNGFTMKDFAKWMLEGKFPRLEGVRDIVSILTNKESRETFLSSDAREAIKVLTAPKSESSLSDATLDQLLREVCKKISAMPYETFKHLKEESITSDEKGLILSATETLIGLRDDIMSEED